MLFSGWGEGDNKGADQTVHISDCAYAQSDHHLCCSYMAKKFFSRPGFNPSNSKIMMLLCFLSCF